MNFKRGSYFRGNPIVRILKFTFASRIDYQLVRRMLVENKIK
jgi:hypothetical protein